MIQKKYGFWLAASIFVAILFSLSGFGLAFETPYTVQDDARQHVFWLQKLNDPELFNQDLIANYFSSVAPAGYKFLYWLANCLGIEPFLFNKILPLLLGIGNTVYLFWLTIEIFPIPLAGFFASFLLNQNLWMLDDLSSGTPRAFFYLLFLGFIYYLLRQQLFPCLLLILLQGLFYPQIVLISAGILTLNLITNKRVRAFYLIGLIVAIAILTIYKLQTGEFNQVIGLQTAKQLPEFYPGGRSSFFLDNPFAFWLTGKRSGFFPYEWQYFLLCLLILFIPNYLGKFYQSPLIKKINDKKRIIGQIVLAALGLFVLSHLLLFKLHLPSRYTQHTWRIVIALIDGIIITIYLQNVWQKITNAPKIFKFITIGATICLLLYPTYAVQSRPYRLGYVNGNNPALYQFLQQQPKNTLIATLSEEGDFIPSLAQRSVLVAEEYSIPYHWDFYQQIRQRAQDLITAQYSQNQTEIDNFIKKYEIDLWLLDKNAFTPPYLIDNSWLGQFQPQTQNAVAILQREKKSIISTRIDRCSVFQTATLDLLDAKCLSDRS